VPSKLYDTGISFNFPFSHAVGVNFHKSGRVGLAH